MSAVCLLQCYEKKTVGVYACIKDALLYLQPSLCRCTETSPHRSHMVETVLCLLTQRTLCKRLTLKNCAIVALARTASTNLCANITSFDKFDNQQPRDNTVCAPPLRNTVTSSARSGTAIPTRPCTLCLFTAHRLVLTHTHKWPGLTSKPAPHSTIRYARNARA